MKQILRWSVRDMALTEGEPVSYCLNPEKTMSELARVAARANQFLPPKAFLVFSTVIDARFFVPTLPVSRTKVAGRQEGLFVRRIQVAQRLGFSICRLKPRKVLCFSSFSILREFQTFRSRSGSVVSFCQLLLEGHRERTYSPIWARQMRKTDRRSCE